MSLRRRRHKKTGRVRALPDINHVQVMPFIPLLLFLRRYVAAQAFSFFFTFYQIRKDNTEESHFPHSFKRHIFLRNPDRSLDYLALYEESGTTLPLERYNGKRPDPSKQQTAGSGGSGQESDAKKYKVHIHN